MANTTSGKNLPGPREGIKKWMKDSRPMRMKNNAKRKTLGDSVQATLPINYSANKYKWGGGK